MRAAALLVALAAGLRAAPVPVVPGDSDRGRQVFEGERCGQCHSVNGRGGRTAPDLGQRVDRGFSPAMFASRLWNHAPTMWLLMEATGMERPRLRPEDAADLFAFLYSSRFFDRPGDPERGKVRFSGKQCSQCHGLTESRAENATPVNRWESLAEPIILVQQMWNHSGKMREAFARRNLPWVRLTSQELSDILAHLRRLPETRHLASRFSYTSGEGGAAVFEEKGCAKCHVGRLALETRLAEMTLNDIAVDMWNHAPRMLETPPTLTQDEMRQLLSYLWMRQFIHPGGSVSRGKEVFTEKRCAECHLRGAHGAPPLPGQARRYSEVTIISALWRHGPQMLMRMRKAGIAWPRFTEPEQLVDLIAYLNSVQ
jgi:mono/diheme cytochrome c family protein